MDRTKRHPNLAKFVSVYEFPNKYAKTGACIVHVLQLWEGGSLLEKVMGLISKGLWNEVYAAQAFSQLLTAARALHEADGTGAFLHCDVKLDNDFVSDESRDAFAILGDFGEVRWVPKDASNPGSVVRHRRFVGTPTYAAPEQLIADREGMHTYSPATDMWAMGVTLYCMLNQSFPFPRDPGRDLNARVAAGRHYGFGATVSEDARSFITRLLSVDASKRPTAAEALEDPWITRATTGDLAKSRAIFNLPTSGVGGSVASDVAATALTLDSEGTREDNAKKGLLAELGGGLSSEQFSFVLDKLREVLGEDADMRAAELNEAQFGEVMGRLEIKGLVTSRLYAVLDADNSGTLSVNELMSGLARITEPSEARARLVFSMYDADGDGSVSISELTDVLRSCATADQDLETVKVHRLVALLSEMDVERTGTVTVDQFLGAVRKDPFVAKLMLQPNLHFKRFVKVGGAGATASGGPWDADELAAALAAE